MGYADIIRTERPTREDIADLIEGTYQSNFYAVTGGSGGNFTATIPGVTAYFNGLRVSLKANHSISGASTLNINSLGVKNIWNPVSAQPLQGSGSTKQININDLFEVVYFDGTFYPTHALRRFDFTPANPTITSGSMSAGAVWGSAKLDRDSCHVQMRFSGWNLSIARDAIYITLPFTPLARHMSFSANVYDSGWKLGFAHYDAIGTTVEIKRYDLANFGTSNIWIDFNALYFIV